jgi:glycosyltransferase involved in cell wall biosynthesis
MAAQPEVSFCFTTFKRKDYLRSTLDSVAHQTFSDYEVIVSDNDPEQSAREVVEGRNDPRFNYFPNEKNLGMKASFNKSLERSSGRYIVMIADDDPVYPDMLETVIGLKDKYPGYGMYIGGSNWEVTDERIARLFNLKLGTNANLAKAPIGTITTYTASDFLKKFFKWEILPAFLWSTGIVRRDVLIEKGGVPDYGTAFLGDYAYMSVVASHSGCVVINKALGHQTIHTQNFGRAQNDQIRTVAINFVDYVSDKIRAVDDFPEIEALMKQFIGLWVVGQLGFLYRYYRLFGIKEEQDLRQIERQVFSIPYVKPYYIKYWLKSRMPGLHDAIVRLKKQLKKK